MLDIAEIETDRRPALLICAYDPADVDWDPVETLDGEAWSPMGARGVTVTGGDPEVLALALSERLALRDCRALLLVGRAHRTDEFRVQMRAENRRPKGVDRVSTTGPSMARSTVPIAEIVRDLQAEGLSAAASSESEDDVGSYLLYRVLTALPDGGDVPAIGLLRVPEDADAPTIHRGVKAAASAIARRLSPLPRSGLG